MFQRVVCKSNLKFEWRLILTSVLNGTCIFCRLIMYIVEDNFNVHLIYLSIIILSKE